jgi:hypothetical protein
MFPLLFVLFQWLAPPNCLHCDPTCHQWRNENKKISITSRWFFISADNNNTIIEYLYSYSLLYLSQFNSFQFILARLVYVYMYDGQAFELGFAQMALDLTLPELPL